MAKIEFSDRLIILAMAEFDFSDGKIIKAIAEFDRLGYCFTPYQRLRLYNGAPFSRLLRHAGDTEDVLSA